MSLIVYDKSQKALGDLQNAFEITETQKINEAYLFSFSLPREDAKNELCQPLYYVRYNGGHLYRILPSQDDLTETGKLTYQCEHVVMSLVDGLLMGYHKIGNRGTYTADVINYVLDKQDKYYDIIAKRWVFDGNKKKNWVLGECDFRREFEYAWTNVSLLDAIFGIPGPIPDKYMWTYNTLVYPWVINLVKIDQTIKPQFYISQGKNLVKLTSVSDPTKLCTRIWPLGQGDADAQLNIAGVNGEVPYVQSDAAHIAKYGLVEKLFEDKRYTVPENLLEAAKSMLAELQDPYQQYQVEFASLDKGYYDTPEIGKIVEIRGFVKTYVVGIAFKHDEILKSTLDIANKPQDVAGNFADMTQRAQIDAAYGQGYTSFLPSHEYGNATPDMPLTLRFTIPPEITDVERVMLDVSMERFRYPFGIEAVNGANTTTGQSGSTTRESSASNTGSGGSGNTGSGGSGNTGRPDTDNTGSVYGHPYTEIVQGVSSTYSGGTDAVTNISTPSRLTVDEDGNITGGGHNHRMGSHQHTIDTFRHNHLFDHSHEIRHAHPVSAHAHPVSAHAHPVSAHTHPVSAHTHPVSAHTHGMEHTHNYAHTHTIRQHDHKLTPNISRAPDNPTTFTIRVNGTDRKTVIGTDIQQLDIKPWLLNEQNDVPKNTRHTVEIFPNAPAYIMMDLLIQGFANSKGEATA